MKTDFLRTSLTIGLLILTFFSDAGWAYVLPLNTVLEKAVAQAGNSIASVDQTVEFKVQEKVFKINESWLIEGDKNLKLTATGEGELKSLFSVTYLYNGKNRTLVANGNRIVSEASIEVFERFLAIKSKDSYLNYLTASGISPQVRLSRAAGIVSFAVGNASSLNVLSPQVWFDQDSFHLVKLRTKNEAEIQFTDYEEYGNLHYPLKKTIEWSNNKVQIVVNRVTAKSGATLKSFYPEAIDKPSVNLISSTKPDLAMVVDEFYKRFR